MKPGSLKRRGSPRRGKPLRRVVIVEEGQVRARREVDPAPALWHRGIRGSLCVACQQKPAIEAHHIIRVQVLRQYAREHGYDFQKVRWDHRNRLGLCRDCHANHHSAARRLSKELLWRYARWVFDFARELDLEWAIDRDYL